MLRVKQGGIKYHFLSFWYDSTWDWTPVSLAIGKHLAHYVDMFKLVLQKLNDLMFSH